MAEMRLREVAHAILLVSEHEPEPPLRGGSFETARPEIVRLVERRLQPFVVEIRSIRMAA